jgi:hypothetical protein
MNWNRGFSALYELHRVDPVSWQDAGQFEIISGTISKSEKGLIESADFVMTESPGECWLRAYLKAKQGESGARVPLFTGLASAPQRSLKGNDITFKAACYSALKPVEDMLVPRGFFVAAGASGAKTAAELLRVGPAPVTYATPSPTLSEAIVAENKDTYLAFAQKIVDAIGWRIRINGRGEISIAPKPDTEAARFDERENDSIEVNITDTNDWYSAPNCIRVTSGSDCIEYRDDSKKSKLSTVSRKANRGGTGEIWKTESASSLSETDTLLAYAERRLKELQSPARKISYTRRFRPDVTISDMVRLHLPGHGIDGVFTVSSQKITLGYAASVSEEVTG